MHLWITFTNSSSTNPSKWSNTLKQFVSKLPTNCSSVFDHFVRWAFKGLKNLTVQYIWTIKKQFLFVLNSLNCIYLSFYQNIYQIVWSLILQFDEIYAYYIKHIKFMLIKLYSFCVQIYAYRPTYSCCMVCCALMLQCTIPHSVFNTFKVTWYPKTFSVILGKFKCF